MKGCGDFSGVSLAVDGILPDGSRDVWGHAARAQSAALCGGAVSGGLGSLRARLVEGSPENISYYQRAARNWGRGARGVTAIAGGAWGELYSTDAAGAAAAAAHAVGAPNPLDAVAAAARARQRANALPPRFGANSNVAQPFSGAERGMGGDHTPRFSNFLHARSGSKITPTGGGGPLDTRHTNMALPHPSFPLSPPPLVFEPPLAPPLGGGGVVGALSSSSSSSLSHSHEPSNVRSPTASTRHHSTGESPAASLPLPLFVHASPVAAKNRYSPVHGRALSPARAPQLHSQQTIIAAAMPSSSNNSPTRSVNFAQLHHASSLSRHRQGQGNHRIASPASSGLESLDIETLERQAIALEERLLTSGRAV